MWATAEGRSGVTEDPGGLPLGIEPGEGYPVTRRTLDSDGAIVLLTDGVVEGPSLLIEDGLERVRRLIAGHVGASASWQAWCWARRRTRATRTTPPYWSCGTGRPGAGGGDGAGRAARVTAPLPRGRCLMSG